MSDRARHILRSVTLALAAVGLTLVMTYVYLASPLNGAAAPPTAAGQGAVADAIFAALLALAPAALIVASLLADWRDRSRLLARLAAGSLMVVGGCLAALLLNPTSQDLQARYMAYPDLGSAAMRETGGAARAQQFTSLIDRLSALSWIYAACAVGILLTIALLVALRRRSASASLLTQR